MRTLQSPSTSVEVWLFRLFFDEMIVFTSFPQPLDHSPAYAAAKNHKDADDDALMDLDDDFGSSDSRLTCPGESLTSAQAFMR